LENINAEAGLKGDTLTILQATGHAGKGELSGKGNMKFSGLIPSNYDFSARMKNIDIVFKRGVSGLFDGSIAFRGPVTSPILSGDIAIREARLTQWFEWEGLVLDKLIKKYRGDIRIEDKRDINLSVSISSDKGLFVKNNLAQAELKGKGSIVGSVRNPSFIGSLEFIKGFVYYLDNKFDIKTGTINFSDEKELVPIIDISAAALKKRVKDMRTVGGEIKEWKDYRILLHAYGRPTDLKITLSSEPSDLSDAEIHSVLAAGIISGEEYGGITLGKATAYEFGRVLATRIAEGIGSMTIGEEDTEKAGGLFRQAVDTVQLSPASDASTNATRLTVGKSWSERLEGSLSTELGGKGGGRADLKYTLNKHFSLIGSWDNDSAILMGDPDPLGNIGGDIVFTLGFR
jgi:autotransporter translocation and assembly factor TamB